MNGTWPTECVRDAFSWSCWLCASVLYTVIVNRRRAETYARHHEEISFEGKLEQSLNQAKLRWGSFLGTLRHIEIRKNSASNSMFLPSRNFAHWNDEWFKLWLRFVIEGRCSRKRNALQKSWFSSTLSCSLNGKIQCFRRIFKKRSLKFAWTLNKMSWQYMCNYTICIMIEAMLLVLWVRKMFETIFYSKTFHDTRMTLKWKQNHTMRQYGGVNT